MEHVINWVNDNSFHSHLGAIFVGAAFLAILKHSKALVKKRLERNVLKVIMVILIVGISLLMDRGFSYLLAVLFIFVIVFSNGNIAVKSKEEP